MSGFYDAYEARKAAEAMIDTWGHLRPVKDKIYSGYILYTVGCFGDIVCIESKFEELPDSPWFYEDLREFIGDNGEQNSFIYLFTGTYRSNRDPKFLGVFLKITAATLFSVIQQKNGGEKHG